MHFRKNQKVSFVAVEEGVAIAAEREYSDQGGIPHMHDN